MIPVCVRESSWDPGACPVIGPLSSHDRTGMMRRPALRRTRAASARRRIDRFFRPTRFSSPATRRPDLCSAPSAFRKDEDDACTSTDRVILQTGEALPAYYLPTRPAQGAVCLQEGRRRLRGGRRIGKLSQNGEFLPADLRVGRSIRRASRRPFATETHKFLVGLCLRCLSLARVHNSQGLTAAIFRLRGEIAPPFECSSNDRRHFARTTVRGFWVPGDPDGS